MPKFSLIVMLLLAASTWAGATMQRGCKDTQNSLFNLMYPAHRDMRRIVAFTPQKGSVRAPDTLTVPINGAEREPDMALLMSNRDAVVGRFVDNTVSDDSSLARGERTFHRLCQPCHGPAMQGDGPVAGKFMPPPDLLGATTRGRSDGYIYSCIRYGGAIMPKYGQALSPAATWDVIHYVRHQQKVSPR
jgi:mono/diheme cytochrome c family protein